MIEIQLLGTAQDGGLPHFGCRCPHCDRARGDRSFRRLVASVGIVDQITGERWLIDASPDLGEQWLMFGRPTGLFLTHGHVGHFAGLLHLGKETANVRGLTLHASESMHAFLAGNAPWSWLVTSGALEPVRLTAGRPFTLSNDLTIIPTAVPHRAEFTDTLGFEIQGPSGSLFYCPDTDAFEPWAADLRAIADRVDVAVLDGTFWSTDEIPGRDLALIPHPFVAHNLDLLADLATRCEVRLTHFNHSNPLLDENAVERDRVAESGVGLAADGMLWRF